MDLLKEFLEVKTALAEIKQLMTAKKEEKKVLPEPSELPPILTGKQARQALGITEQGLFLLRKRGVIRSTTKHNRVYISRDELIRYLSTGEQFAKSKKSKNTQ